MTDNQNPINVHYILFLKGAHNLVKETNYLMYYICNENDVTEPKFICPRNNEGNHGDIK